MARKALVCTASLVALLGAVGWETFGIAFAADRSSPVVQAVGTDATSRFIPLGVGKSVVIDLPRDIKDVLVGDPKIANAVIRSSRRAYIVGASLGQTNIYFFDADGNQIFGLDIAVTRDLNGIRAALKKALPGAEVNADGIGDGVLLTGSVATAAEAQAAFDIAWRLTGDKEKVSNNITVQNRDQVMLKVTAAEMQRDIVKQLGIDLGASMTSGSKVLTLQNFNPFSANGQPLVAGNQVLASNGSLAASLRAMERAGVIHTLAEPTLTAISGETASFLAGGEFPINTGVSCDPASAGTATQNCHATIVFKKFGVSLTFLPVVLSEGRISLRVMTEVSELSSEILLTSADGTTIPSIKTRRAETTVEIPSGGTLAMAGMIQQQTKQQLNGLPGLMQLPILGTLFKSRDYVNRQTELAFFITPYVVHATAQKELSRPDDGFADASDPATVLLGNVNRIYGVPAQAEPKPRYYGNIGFILD